MIVAAPVCESMRAAVIRPNSDGRIGIHVEQVATPRAAEDEVLVAVAAVGLNHLDVFARAGLDGPGVHAVTLPHVSGVDVAGTVAALGDRMDGPPVGTRVVLNPVGAAASAACPWADGWSCAAPPVAIGRTSASASCTSIIGRSSAHPWATGRTFSMSLINTSGG